MDDIFDTRFEGRTVEVEDHRSQIGDDINLSEKDPTLRNVIIGMGWDTNTFNADALDIDLSAFLVNKDGVTSEDADFIFYNNPKDTNEAIVHQGDSRTGAGDGDDECIAIDLQKVPFHIVKIIFSMTIYKGHEIGQNLSMVRNAYMRVISADNDHELTRYVLDEDLEDLEETGFIVGSLNREGPKWHFTPIGEAVLGGLREIATRYDLIITDQ